MHERYKELTGLKVETESGEALGKLVDIVLDTEVHEVKQYVVSKSRVLSKLLPAELVVASQQVISITRSKMTVRDSVVEELAAKSAVVAAERATQAVQGVSSSTTE